MRQVEKDVRGAVTSGDFVNSTVSGGLAGTVGKTCGVQRSSSFVLAAEHFLHAGQKWECSQGENEKEERDANWLMADQLMRQWDEVSKDEEEITVERRLQVDEVQNAPAPLAAQAHTSIEKRG